VGGLLSEAELLRSPSLLRSSTPVGILTLAVGLIVGRSIGRGVVGQLTGAAQVCGWAFLVVACVTGSILLAAGAYSVWHGRRRLAVIIPLAGILAWSGIGELLDIIAGTKPMIGSTTPGQG
jgi:hypothetical protein